MMKDVFKAFGFALGICIGLMLFAVGNVLLVEGVLGDVFDCKEILIGLVLDFIGLFILFLTINISNGDAKKGQGEVGDE